MALFEVPGWTVLAAPVSGPSTSSQPARNRKRKHGGDGDEAGVEKKVKTAAVNMEKLMAELGPVGGGDDESKKSKGNAKGKGRERKPRGDKATEKAKAGVSEGAKGKGKGKGKAKAKDDKAPTQDVKKKGKETSQAAESSERPQKRQRKKKGDAPDTQTGPQAVTEKVPSVSKKGLKGKATNEGGSNLTTLQANMKQSLDGARFRWINERMYKSDSTEARDMMRENPSVFAEYHAGFRHQVQTWPSNPVAHYIDALSSGSYTPRTVIADLGCGDAALARALVPQNFSVLSFDLVSDGKWVVEADVCARIPLPGGEEDEDAEESEDDQPQAQVVDVVVCALSLMSKNWVGCVREAWRILKPKGELKIAEVASRFTNIEDFTSLVSAVGFKMRSKDDSNSHFTLFEFVKTSRAPKSEQEWEKLMDRGSVLKPCEYKRR